MAYKTYAESMEQLVRDMSVEFGLKAARLNELLPLEADDELVTDIAVWLDGRVSLDDRP